LGLGPGGPRSQKRRLRGNCDSVEGWCFLRRPLKWAGVGLSRVRQKIGVGLWKGDDRTLHSNRGARPDWKGNCSIRGETKMKKGEGDIVKSNASGGGGGEQED